MSKIKRIPHSDYIHFLDETNNYLIMVSKKNKPLCLKYSEISFLAPKVNGSTNRFITGREIDETPNLRNYVNSTDLQIVDIGAGLHGFVPNIVANQTTNQPKPIIIDPINYSIAQNLLKYAENNLSESDVSQEIIQKIKQLITRTEIIQNPDLVKLYNIPVEEASIMPELKNIGDLVINNYVNTNKEILNYFKKPEGTIVRY